MPDKSLRMRRAGGDGVVKRPVMLAIAGDSAAGKTTLTRGLVEALGPERCCRCASTTTTAMTGRSARGCRSPRCTRTATTSTSWSSTCSCWPRAARCSSRSTTTRPASWSGPSWSSRASSSSWRGCCRCTAGSRGPVSTSRCTSTRPRTSGRLEGRPRHRRARLHRRKVMTELERREAERRRSSGRSGGRRHRRTVRADRGPQRSAGHAAVSGLMLRPTIRHPDLTDVFSELTGAMHLKLERDDDGRPVETPAHPRVRAARGEPRGGEGDLGGARRAELRPGLSGPDRRGRAANRWPSPSYCCSTT